MGTIIHEGVAHPVTDAWDARNSSPWPHFASLDLVGCEERRQQIYRLDGLGLLTRALRMELWHLTHHINARIALGQLGIDAHVKHGFPGVDHLHGCRIEYPCGCAVRVVLDHHAWYAAVCAADIVTPHDNPGVQAWRQYLWEYASAVSGDDPATPSLIHTRNTDLKLHAVIQTCMVHDGITNPQELIAAVDKAT